MSAPELSWGWPEICCTLMWKLAPEGVTITRGDLHALPQDLVLMHTTLHDRMEFKFVELEYARRLRDIAPQTGSEKIAVSSLEGRWQKIATTLLWKLAKGGVILMQWDRDALPADRVLLAHGHAKDIEYRFVPRSEATRLANWERDNEGKIVMETVQ